MAVAAKTSAENGGELNSLPYSSGDLGNSDGQPDALGANVTCGGTETAA